MFMGFSCSAYNSSKVLVVLLKGRARGRVGMTAAIGASSGLRNTRYEPAWQMSLKQEHHQDQENRTDVREKCLGVRTLLVLFSITCLIAANQQPKEEAGLLIICAQIQVELRQATGTMYPVGSGAV